MAGESSGRDRPRIPTLSDAADPLREVRDSLAHVTRRLDDLVARVARLAPADAAPPVGESLSEAERRGLAPSEGLLALGPGPARETARVLAIDRAIHVTGADCAALYLPAAGGELVAPVHRGFVPPPPRLPLDAGIVGRALGERDTIRGGPGDRARD